MGKNVMKMLKPSPSHGRNAIDMSARDVQSYNIGELLPVYCLETVPNDKIVIRPADLVRACPMVTSPFLRLKQHIDFWFVPYQQLWSRWNEFIVDKSEPQSAALHDRLFVPSFNLANAIAAIKSDDGTHGVTNVLGGSFRKDAARLLDALGYPAQAAYYNDWSIMPDSVSVNPFRLAAYQKIWYTEYRQQYYDDGSLGVNFQQTPYWNPAYLFNFDDLVCDTLANSDIFMHRCSDPADPYASVSCFAYMAQLRRRCWKKDLFTGLMPSTQFGNVSTFGENSSVNIVTSSAVGTSSGALSAKRPSSSSSRLQVQASPSSSWSTLYTNNIVDVLQLRYSEALQKWRENALRAGNFVEDNFEAHYGVKPKSHIDCHPILIGSVDAPVNIGDVDVTAVTLYTTNGHPGDIAGKAISHIADKEFHFQTNDFGVVMGIFSILPEAEYESLGIDRPNQLLERFDFFTPEMENIGLEAVDYHTMNCEYGSGSLGYAPRYWAYKTKIDKVHLDFFRQHSGTGGAAMVGVFPQWCSPRNVWPQSTPALKNLYVDHSTFSYNFYTNQTAQFLVDMFIDCTALRPMSISGMPSY